MSDNSGPGNLPVAAVVGSGATDAGDRLGINVVDIFGVECVIMIPHELEGQFLLHVQNAASVAAERRAKKTQRGQEVVFPLEVDQIQAIPVDRDMAILRLRLKSGLKLDLPLDQSTRQQIRELFDQVEAKMAKKGSSPKVN